MEGEAHGRGIDDNAAAEVRAKNGALEKCHSLSHGFREVAFPEGELVVSQVVAIADEAVKVVVLPELADVSEAWLIWRAGWSFHPCSTASSFHVGCSMNRECT